MQEQPVLLTTDLPLLDAFVFEGVPGCGNTLPLVVALGGGVDTMFLSGPELAKQLGVAH